MINQKSKNKKGPLPPPPSMPNHKKKYKDQQSLHALLASSNPNTGYKSKTGNDSCYRAK